jgi:hypothetical protein
MGHQWEESATGCTERISYFGQPVNNPAALTFAGREVKVLVLNRFVPILFCKEILNIRRTC